MNQSEWMRHAEWLLNRMENASYKSHEYLSCKAALEDHMRSNPAPDDRAEFAWEMTLPGPIGVVHDTPQSWSQVPA